LNALDEPLPQSANARIRPHCGTERWAEVEMLPPDDESLVSHTSFELSIPPGSAEKRSDVR
jgi:hypothetical protein